MSELAYPPARRGEVADDYHGELIADPYRWLEDADSDETKAWVAAENELSERWLSGVPSREAIRQRMTELWSFPRSGVPLGRGGRWFQFRNSGLQDQQVLFVMESPDAAGRVLLDPNTLSADGTVAVTSLSVSTDGRLLAYATSTGGSDWRTWHVRQVDDGSDLDDIVDWSKYTEAAWLGDGSGYYYGAPDAPEPGTELRAESRRLRVMLHRLGTPQADDELVFAAADEPEWVPQASVTADGRYLVISISRGTAPESQIQVLDLENPSLGLRPLAGDFSAAVEVVTNVGSRFYLRTDADAERQRVVAVELDAAAGGRGAWHEIVAERDDTLVSVQHCGDALVCHYLENAHSALRIYGLEGSYVGDVPLPGLVSLFDDDLLGVTIRGWPGEPIFHFRVTSFLESGSTWSHDLETGETQLVRDSPARLDAGEYVTEEVFVTSEDGTRIPMFLSRRRDVAPTGEVPVLLDGYGGFNVSISPVFSVSMAVWMERGGIYAQAILRGGGEFGTAWHDAGRLAHKQNVFDDFCACARSLADEGWSRPERLAITGGSNGGLLVGACLTQHPELFGAAVPEVGVFDLLRFHKFTIGWAWTSDFGDPDDPEQYLWPRGYSPLHHVVSGTKYPPVLIMTGDHDDRVIPGHSFKFAATLQAAVAGVPESGPILLRVETSAGHGAGKPTTKQIAERTDVLSFLEVALGLA